MANAAVVFQGYTRTATDVLSTGAADRLRESKGAEPLHRLVGGVRPALANRVV
jgi:hypothetical protein